MGAKVGGNAGGFNDINMTPLIDIVLVVLIIMMVNIPIQVNRLGVKLPGPTTDVTPPPPDTEQLAIAIYEDGRIALNRTVLIEDTSVLLERTSNAATKDTVLFPLFQEISRRLKSATKKNVFIDAHPAVNYGVIVDMMDLAREAGAVNVGLAKVKETGPLDPVAVAAGVMPRGVILGSPSVVGYISEKKADEALKPYVPRFLACYEAALATDPRLTGRILARVEVQYQGQLMKSAVEQSSMQNPPLEACVAEVIAGLTFPPLDGTDEKPDYERTAAVIYPLLFSPG